MSGRRHEIEHWRVAAMLLLTLAAAIALYYILTDPSRAVAAWYMIGAAIVGMGLLVKGTGP